MAGAATRLLFVTSWRDYLDRMDRFTYDFIDAAHAYPRVNVTVWGKGWHGWDSMGPLASGAARLQARFGRCPPFDAIVTMQVTNDIEELEWPADCEGRPPVRVFEIPDCAAHKEPNATHSHEHPCVRAVPAWADVVMSRYSGPLMALFIPTPPHLTGRPRLYTHNPDCVNEAHFSLTPQPLDSRPESVQLFGSVWSFYPMRDILKRTIESLGKGRVYTHPGYHMLGKGRNAQLPEPPPAYTPSMHATFVPQAMAQARAYAQAMEATQLCVFDGTVTRKEVKKYFEAMRAGCAVGADLPLGVWSELRPAMVELPRDGTVNDYKHLLTKALAHPHSLAQRAEAGRAIVTRSFMCSSKVERLLSDIAEYHAGRRGLKFPFSTSLDCHSYASNWRLPHLSWCGGQ